MIIDASPTKASATLQIAAEKGPPEDTVGLGLNTSKKVTLNPKP